jgi:hypothetical protein
VSIKPRKKRREWENRDGHEVGKGTWRNNEAGERDAVELALSVVEIMAV